ncbi:MAG: 50S ribosomal protein L4 [Candidatus Bathyarchaeota archaeon]|nr:MAG: 50S ribosomal protein L4 [Candidatus Bathyarchaeota archaeon]
MTIVPVLNLRGEPDLTVELPKVFNTLMRPDLIKRAVLAQQSHRIQPQGRDPMAGKRTTAESMGTGYGISRMPRTKGSRYPKARQAALAPGTVGGRQPHPPKSEKNIYKKFNKKERKRALYSAIAATSDKNIVASRGHIIDDVHSFPIVVSDDLQKLNKASEVRDFFKKIGVWPDIERVKKSKKIRAGRGKSRGRRKRHSVGPLIIISEDNGIKNGVSNFLGADIAEADKINVELLAPGANPGRLTIWTLSAFKDLDTLFSERDDAKYE